MYMIVHVDFSFQSCAWWFHYPCRLYEAESELSICYAVGTIYTFPIIIVFLFLFLFSFLWRGTYMVQVVLYARDCLCIYIIIIIYNIILYVYGTNNGIIDPTGCPV